jgi:hypothetical protein
MDEEQIATALKHREEPEAGEELKMEEEERLPNGTSHGAAHEAPEPPKDTTCPECAARKQSTEQKKPTPFETGIRAFNLKRAASSAGRPVGVRATTESKKSKKKAAKKKKKKAKHEVKEEESEEEDSSEEEEDEEPATKPMSIRLDLNLVVEIFLKAKIQGDVTITFL